MRKTLFVLFAFSVHCTNAQSFNSPGAFNVDSFLTAKRTAPLGKPFPSFWATTGGRTVSNDLFNGKVVLINFWFEGCLPCMAEMDALNSLQQQLDTTKDFLFVSFTYDNAAAIKRVKGKYSLTFGVLSTSQQECRRLNFDNGYPTHMILDRTGTIKYLHSGGSTNKEKAKAFIMSTLLPEITSLL